MADYRIEIQLDSNNAYSYYNIGCLYSLKEDGQNAFLFLKKAASKWNYLYDDFREFSKLLKTDQDLDFVRKQNEFPRFLREYSPSQ